MISIRILIGNSDFLVEIKEATILGVVVQSTLYWDSQIQQIVGKTTKAAWTLRSMKVLSVDTATLTQFWRTEGRVHLDYQATFGTQVSLSRSPGPWPGHSGWPW